ncbi:MAG: MarR family transcriptional regulator [Flavobacteriales bacterium]|nr:MarR family transcriptional regulator [Flavobacteriales bacterium]MCB0758773.1 MarR family transcriptional regulator [Flavobacteriales bacterium]
MSDLKDHYNSCLFHAGAALGRSLTRMAEAHFHPIEITPTMGFILMSAKEAPGINVKDLAYVHQLDPSTISRTLDKLASNSYVVRNGHERIVEVFLTPEGLNKAAEASSAWEKLRLAYMHLLGEGEAKRMAELSARTDAVLRVNL